MTQGQGFISNRVEEWMLSLDIPMEKCIIVWDLNPQI